MIAKEITKLHEDFIRGDVDKIKLSKISLKGELTAVISNQITLKKTLMKKKLSTKQKNI